MERKTERIQVRWKEDGEGEEKMSLIVSEGDVENPVVHQTIQFTKKMTLVSRT